MLGRNRVLGENNQKRMVQIVFLIGYSGAGLQFALFSERIGNLAADEILIGVDQGILEKELVEVIPQKLVVGTPQFVGQAQFFAVLPECQKSLLSAQKRVALPRPDSLL